MLVNKFLRKIRFMTALLIISAVYIIIFNHITVAQNNYYESIPPNVNRIASAITVLLKYKSSDSQEFFPRGSGVIIDKKNNEYSILTVAHNLDRNGDDKVDSNDKIINDYQVEINDNKYKYNDNKYYVTNYTLLRTQKLGTLDLAVLNFSSQNDYQIANFKDYQGRLFVNSIQPREDIYVAGFPETSLGFKIDKGKFVRKRLPRMDDKFRSTKKIPGETYSPDTSHKAFTGGYSLDYRPISSIGMAPGMSGGPILTSNGYLIGVHGRESANDVKKGIGIDVFINAYSEEKGL